MSDDKRLASIEMKVDKVIDHISSIDITLAKQSVILDEHVKRTNLLQAKVEPLEKHAAMVYGSIRFIILVSALAGIYAVLK